MSAGAEGERLKFKTQVYYSVLYLFFICTAMSYTSRTTMNKRFFIYAVWFAIYVPVSNAVIMLPKQCCHGSWAEAKIISKILWSPMPLNRNMIVQSAEAESSNVIVSG